MKIILIIDDEVMIRNVFCMALRRSGYRVIEAETTTRGLELARKHMPDLILCDICLPGGGGEDFLKSIRADPELRSRQVVLMTGHPDIVPARRVMEQGADDFLAKPVSVEALRACVEARLSRAAVHWRVEDEKLTEYRDSMQAQLPHEFITPLAGILGLSELLEAGCSSFSPEELQDFHRDIRQSALRLHRTVRNYLLMLELQNDDGRDDRPPPLLTLPDIQDSVRNGVDFVLQRHNRAQDLSIELADCPLCVRQEDFVRIIEELLDNAFKFSRSGTSVVLRLTPEGKLSMEDEGRGMTEEEIRQVGAFRQFNRKKHEQQGLGLGLTLVQKLVERNGGRCEVARRPEAGIEVAIWFAKSIAEDLGETSAPKQQVAQLAL